MKYVLDSSVAFKWQVTESDTDIALRLRDDARSGSHLFIAPDIFPVEVLHSLTRAERQNRVTVGDGWRLWLGILADAPILYPSFSLLPRAYAISSKARVGVYDCLYVALAEREGCELITADLRLVTNLQPSFPFILPLSCFP